jgi:hypothetical protein
MASLVSALSGLVANGHQVMHSGSSSLSKIPYGGFSPVRLQTGFQPRPSPTAHTRPRLIRGQKSAAPSPTGIPLRGSHRFKAALEKQSRGRFRSRGPWLANGLFCPAGSLLTMASSESLASIRRLMILRPADTQNARESQLLSACPFFRAIGPTPADRVVVGGSNATRAAFDDLGRSRHPRIRLIGSRRRRNEAAPFALCYGPEDCSPCTEKGFYIRAFIP